MRFAQLQQKQHPDTNNLQNEKKMAQGLPGMSAPSAPFSSKFVRSKY